MLLKESYTQDEVKDIISNIAIGVSSSTGDEFFDKLTLHLWKLYKMSYILIGTYNEDENSVTTLKFCVNGQIVDNITYSLEHTPCSKVVKSESAIYTKNVLTSFPKDQFFIDNNIESYLGIRLVDSVNNGIGLISCIDTKEITCPIIMHSILEIFASRASSEIERMRTEESLEEHIQARTIELSRALNLIQEQNINKVLKSEKMAALGSMVSGFTHDLNTPIGISVTGSTYIMSQSKSILQKIEEENLSKNDLVEFLEDSFKMAEAMYKNLDNARELIKSFKLISIDQHIEDEKEFYLKSYIDDILKSLHYKLKNLNINIENNVPNDIKIFASAGVFFQILSNLIQNSIKHGFENLDKGDIKISASYENNILNMIYEDNGKGMSKESKDRIFEQFYTTKKDSGGTGLGMFTTYELISTRLKGSIKLESEPNKGVKFSIKIPIREY